MPGRDGQQQVLGGGVQVVADLGGQLGDPVVVQLVGGLVAGRLSARVERWTTRCSRPISGAVSGRPRRSSSRAIRGAITAVICRSRVENWSITGSPTSSDSLPARPGGR
jgi:hypothetical protein